MRQRALDPLRSCLCAQTPHRQPLWSSVLRRRPGLRQGLHGVPPSTHLRSPECSGGRPTSQTSPSSTPSPSWAECPVRQREELGGASARPALPAPQAGRRGSCRSCRPPRPPPSRRRRSCGCRPGCQRPLRTEHPRPIRGAQSHGPLRRSRPRHGKGHGLGAAHLPRGHSYHIWVTNEGR